MLEYKYIKISLAASFVYIAMLTCVSLLPSMAETGATLSDAEALNAKGYIEFRKKNYRKAADLFLMATKKKPALIKAHHNYACALALDRTILDRKKKINAIVSHLSKTIDLDLSRIEKILSDPDLDPVRKYSAFIRFITSGSPLDSILYEPCPGDCCPEFYHYFSKDGWVAMGNDEPNLYNGEPTFPAPAIEGRYAIVKGKLVLYYPKFGQFLYDVLGEHRRGDDFSLDNISDFKYFDFDKEFKRGLISKKKKQ